MEVLAASFYSTHVHAKTWNLDIETWNLIISLVKPAIDDMDLHKLPN